MSLTFDALRIANVLRLPQFKNSKGEPAHTQADGSDWTVAQWVQAWLGEVGEFCEVRCMYEAGKIGPDDYAREAAKELPDSIIYQSILSLRALDDTSGTESEHDRPDRAQLLMALMARLGGYANMAKKNDRGDISAAELDEYARNTLPHVAEIAWELTEGRYSPNKTTSLKNDGGIDLGAEVVHKFNATSLKVNSSIMLIRDRDGHHRAHDGDEAARTELRNANEALEHAQRRVAAASASLAMAAEGRKDE